MLLALVKKTKKSMTYRDRPQKDLNRESFAVPMNLEKIRTLKDSAWIFDDVSSFNI
jgi:hypothetical protein